MLTTSLGVFPVLQIRLRTVMYLKCLNLKLGAGTGEEMMIKHKVGHC